MIYIHSHYIEHKFNFSIDEANNFYQVCNGHLGSTKTFRTLQKLNFIASAIFQ